MNDERVSKTYRSVATERTPGRLDEAVLAEAARAAKPRYSRLRTWTRPLAWAATIALSVAIVLELTRAPMPDVDISGGEPARLQMQQLPAAESKAEPATAAEPEAASIPEATAELEAPAALDDIASDAPREDQGARRVSDERRERAFEADAFTVKDADMRQQAEEFVRLQEGAVAADAAQGRSAAVASSAAPGCDDAVTDDPETWLSCIEDLEAAGFGDEAELQRELLAARYPDFESD